MKMGVRHTTQDKEKEMDGGKILCKGLALLKNEGKKGALVWDQIFCYHGCNCNDSS